jgi:Tfp pilus assembly protein PilO
MKTDRIIMIVVPLVALAAAFWLLILSPKRSESSELETKADQLRSSISAAEATVAVGEQARKDFAGNYQQLVVLGKAAPEDDDQSSVIYDLARLTNRNHLNFHEFALASTGDTAVAAAPPPAPTDTASTDGSTSETTTDGATTETAATTPAPATEASAAALPIGATVGTAGLPIMPYSFNFRGEFFKLADFISDVDGQVLTDDKGRPDVHGRLMTIDGFAFGPDPDLGYPQIEGQFAMTTYVVPPEQGIAAGATPTGPAPATTAPATQVSSTTTTTDPAAATSTETTAP